MARPNRFEIMGLYKKEIIEEVRSKGTVLKLNELDKILSENRYYWKLPFATTTSDLILFLNKHIKIEVKTLNFPNRSYEFYFIGDKEMDSREIAMKLSKKGYLSHYSAAYFHDLTENIVKSLYVNTEQTKKEKRERSLNQQNIKMALDKPARSSNNYTYFNGQKIYLLNGQYTDNLGVAEAGGFLVTNIERTLIDIAVRPHYSGGIHEVLNIYKTSKGLFSVNRLVSYLKKIGFTYPYHQSIGFLLQCSGHKESSLDLLKNFPIEYDFYLTHNMKDPKYSKTWKLYYPKEFSL